MEWRLLPFLAAQPSCLEVKLNSRCHFACEYGIKSKYLVPRAFNIANWYTSRLRAVVLCMHGERDQACNLNLRIV